MPLQQTGCRSQLFAMRECNTPCIHELKLKMPNTHSNNGIGIFARQSQSASKQLSDLISIWKKSLSDSEPFIRFAALLATAFGFVEIVLVLLLTLQCLYSLVSSKAEAVPFNFYMIALVLCFFAFIGATILLAVQVIGRAPTQELRTEFDNIFSKKHGVGN